MTFDLGRLAARCAQGAKKLARASSSQKDDALHAAAASLRAAAAQILEANAADCCDAADKGVDAAFADRLRLSEARVEAMARDLESVAALEDPVGEITQSWRRPNGLEISRVRLPLGTLGIVYEARPNVTSDAAALCLKSGNGVLLRGGSQALGSNRAIFEAFGRGIATCLPPQMCQAVGLVPTASREVVLQMLRCNDHLDLLIPRGGPGLIKFVDAHATVPVIKHDQGICHIVVDGTAPLEQVLEVVLNSKTQRPSTCNSAESVLLLQNAVDTHLEPLLGALNAAGVALHLGPVALGAAERLGLPAVAATEDSWGTEFLGLEVSLGVVQDLDAAIAHIDRHGSDHTESLLTQRIAQAERFVRQIQSSVVMINASTRFSDGGQLGLGAEIGISTTKMHAYGPMGLRELTATKFVVRGQGHVRQ